LTCRSPCAGCPCASWYLVPRSSRCSCARCSCRADCNAGCLGPRNLVRRGLSSAARGHEQLARCCRSTTCSACLRCAVGVVSLSHGLSACSFIQRTLALTAIATDTDASCRLGQMPQAVRARCSCARMLKGARPRHMQRLDFGSLSTYESGRLVTATEKRHTRGCAAATCSSRHRARTKRAADVLHLVKGTVVQQKLCGREHELPSWWPLDDGKVH
jgi:hypothetical protein